MKFSVRLKQIRFRPVRQNFAMADQRGQFELKTIRPGRYFFYAYGGKSNWKGLEGLVEFLRRSQDRLQTVDLKANETKQMDLTLTNINQP